MFKQSDYSPKKAKTRKVGNRSLAPILKDLDCQCLVDFNYESRGVGAWFLDNQRKRKFIFGFKFLGIPPYQTLAQFQSFNRNQMTSFRDFLTSEQVTFVMESVADDRRRQEELERLCEGTRQDYLRLLATAERKHVQGLTQMGARQEKRGYIYVSYTVEPSGTKSRDVIEKILNQLQLGWEKWTGEYFEKYSLSMRSMFDEAYQLGYQHWYQLLSVQLGLEIQPMTAEELWEVNWYKFNQSPPVSIPYLIKVSKTGMEEQFNFTKDLREVMFYECLPVIDAHREYIRMGERYIGVLVFAEQREIYEDERQLTRALWNSLSEQVIRTIPHLEIISQIELGSKTAYQEQLRNVAKQSVTMGKMAAKKGEIDVAANLKVEEAVQAQVSLCRDDPPIHCACVVLIYASSPAELDRFCSIYQSAFPQKTWVLREEEYPWRLWLETLPLVMNRLCSMPFDRRLAYSASQVSGLLPLVFTRQFFEKGLEFITLEGGTPLYIDLFSADLPVNMLVLGMTRCGKSVLVSNVLMMALLKGMPVTVVDYPREDGSGSFSDLANFFSEIASYIDFGDADVYNNIFQPPDLSGYRQKIQAEKDFARTEDLEDYVAKMKQERQEAFQEFLVELLMFMIFGPDKGRGKIHKDADLVRSLLVLAVVEFYRNPLICSRFGAGWKGGFGSSAWQEMPTILDFLEFLSPARLNLSVTADAAEARKTLEFMRTQLRAYLSTKIGQRLTRPTSFDSRSPLQIYCLRSLSNETDAAVVSSLSILTALRRSMTYDLSLFFIDEAPVFFKFPCMAQDVGKLCATGLKSGIRVVIASQQPTAISNSVAAADVLANVQIKIVGRIDGSEPIIQSFMAMGFSREEISRATSVSFVPNAEEGYSSWIIQYGEYLEYARFYANPVLLAMVTNNRDEVQQRHDRYRVHNGDKVLALVDLAQKHFKGTQKYLKSPERVA